MQIHQEAVNDQSAQSMSYVEPVFDLQNQAMMEEDNTLTEQEPMQMINTRGEVAVTQQENIQGRIIYSSGE